MKLANIPTIDPAKSWRRFLIGFAVFLIGLILLLSSASEQSLVGFFAITVMATGFLTAMTGYLPMLIQRLTSAKIQNKKSHFD